MSAFPGWPSTFAQDNLLDAGALYLGPNGSGVLLARTLGGFTFDPGRDIKDTDFDGMRAPVKGLQRITSYKSTLKGKIIQFNATQFTEVEPGFASASGSGIVSTYYTMQGASQYFASGSYGTDLRWIFRRSDLSFFQVRFHVWLCYKYTVVSKDKTAAEIDCEFRGLIDPTTSNPFTGANYTTDDAPYGLEAIYAGPPGGNL